MNRCTHFPWFIHFPVASIKFNHPDGSLWREDYCYSCSETDFYKYENGKWMKRPYGSQSEVKPS